MPFRLDRVDGTSALSSLRWENASVCGDEAMIELALSSGHQIELYIPALDGVVELEWLSLASDVLVHLTAMDNDVQRASASQSVGASHPNSYDEGELAYITLSKPEEAVLRYFVIGCNSEWDERFVRYDDQWVRVAAS